MCTKAETIEQIRQTAQKTMPPNGKLILFGSQARGDAHEGSDWDLLVIIDKERLLPEDYDAITYPLTYLGWTIGEEINPIMYTQQEWNKSRITPFYENVLRDGITLLTA